MAAEAFLEGEDGMVLDVPKKTIKVSKIFDWYSEDFGSSKEKVRFAI